MLLIKEVICTLNEYLYDDELRHYGVVGMKWGVRRAKKSYMQATTAEGRQKAIAKLESHRAKATNKVTKLETKHEKLEKKSDKYAQRNDVKAAKLKRKAAKKTRKAYTGLRTPNRRAQLKWKGDMLNAKADALIAKSNEVKAKIAKNETLQKKFNQGINDIDKTLVEYGRKKLRG